MALTPQESAIMDLRDEGLATAEIAKRLQIKPETARRVVSMYDGSGDERRHAKQMRLGSAALLTAIRRAEAL